MLSKTLTLILFICFLSNGFGQSAIVTVGSTVSGTGGSLSFTSGQVVYTCLESADYSLSQGVQQAFEVSVRTGDPSLPSWASNLKVYPNPMDHSLFLHHQDRRDVDLRYAIYNLNGKIITACSLGKTLKSIDVSSLLPATYLLQFYNPSMETFTIKIIKK